MFLYAKLDIVNAETEELWNYLAMPLYIVDPTATYKARFLVDIFIISNLKKKNYFFFILSGKRANDIFKQNLTSTYIPISSCVLRSTGCRFHCCP